MSYKRFARIAVRTMAAAGALLACGAGAAFAGIGTDTNGQLYYTTFNPVSSGGKNYNLWSVNYNFTAATDAFSFSGNTGVALTTGADGLIFNPLNTNQLIIGGQGPRVNLVDLTDPSNPKSITTPSNVYHVSVDPTNTSHVWGSDIPGQPVSIGVSATGLTGTTTQFSVGGDDSGVDSLAYAGGHIFYTSSQGNGVGDFGTLTFSGTTATTTRIASGDGYHGMSFDPFTGDIFTFGAKVIHQYDSNGVLLSSLTVNDPTPVSNNQLDQGVADGHGHLLIANNDGNLAFVDYSQPGNLVASSDFVSPTNFLNNNLDDVAPLVGVGSHSNPVPEPAFFQLGGLLALGGLGAIRRRLKA